MTLKTSPRYKLILGRPNGRLVWTLGGGLQLEDFLLPTELRSYRSHAAANRARRLLVPVLLEQGIADADELCITAVLS